MTTHPSPHPSGLSLTDELAEATNELLDLRGPNRQRPLPHPHPHLSLPPLPTPSPLSLSSSGPPTLSSALAVSGNAKLTLIFDGDDEVRPDRRANLLGPTPNSPSNPRSDGDDHLPSSRLNRMVASVSNTPVPPSTSTFPSEGFKTDSWSNERGAHSRARATPSEPSRTAIDGPSQLHHTPAFFLQSFPHARGVSAETSSGSSQGVLDEAMAAQPPSAAFGLPVSEPVKASVSKIDDAAVTVQLHGNGRLERQAEKKLDRMQGREHDLPTSASFADSQHSDRGEGEDSSSLLSLPASSITGSSQTSHRAQRRTARRRSTGSVSLATEDLDSTEDVPFARDVLIRGFTVVGEKSRGFVCYDVRVITIGGTTISILRRFSSFCQLRQCLASERPQHVGLLPPLPPRRAGLLHKYASHHLEKRRRALQKWLVIVMLDRRWGTTKSLREWVVGSSDEA